MTYETLIETAKMHSPLVDVAAKHTACRTNAMRRDQLKLVNSLRSSYEVQTQDLSGAALQKQVVNYLETELKNYKEFDVARKQSGAPILPFQVSFHKMSFILEKTHEFFNSEEDGSHAFHNLAQGIFEPEDSFWQKYPMLRTNTYFGSNTATLESAKMLCFRFATSRETIQTYAQTSITHVTPTEHLPTIFQNSNSKFFTHIKVKGKLVPGFGFVHGGYAFGGQRREPRQLEFGPEDCSSIVHNWLDSSIYRLPYRAPVHTQFSTADELRAWRQRGQRGLYFIDKNPAASTWDEYFKKTIDKPITAKHTQAGDLILIRTAQSDKDFDSHAAGSGHTGVVIGDDPVDASKVLIFECARDMEAENPEKNIWGNAGVGVGSFSKQYHEETLDNKTRRTMFLRPKIS